MSTVNYRNSGTASKRGYDDLKLRGGALLHLLRFGRATIMTPLNQALKTRVSNALRQGIVVDIEPIVGELSELYPSTEIDDLALQVIRLVSASGGAVCWGQVTDDRPLQSWLRK